ncbi:uncharacterized protein BDR25DRAFT_396772 [Lindgomyces ingoldianus]|uniref:Uncharacterized protein n=1 Tax=Lindgomyces ingoldianus TaxID=673940 RepID=A0ACB6QBC6_9PLEO|nr:uncharacterized protein BDR25DRAFT_396772 [Lindgomyces ingoldianus]KAF2464238.1 hypothetical protein BDR25DRAFT_396772 [Lindgomyces ingoldianus]
MQQQIQQLRTDITTGHQATEYNSLARLQNSRIARSDIPLREVTTNAYVQGSPATPAQLSNMSGPALDHVLTALSLPTNGETADKKQLLRFYVELMDMVAIELILLQLRLAKALQLDSKSSDRKPPKEAPGRIKLKQTAKSESSSERPQDNVFHQNKKGSLELMSEKTEVTAAVFRRLWVIPPATPALESTQPLSIAKERDDVTRSPKIPRRSKHEWKQMWKGVWSRQRAGSPCETSGTRANENFLTTACHYSAMLQEWEVPNCDWLDMIAMFIIGVRLVMQCLNTAGPAFRTLQAAWFMQSRTE